MALAMFLRWRVYFDAGSDPSFSSVAGQFTESVPKADSPGYGYYCQNIFEMKDGTGAFTVRERGSFGIHYLNTTGGLLDTSWITADFTAVESAMATLWSSYGGASVDTRLVEHRWYAFGPGIVKPNPPARVNTLVTPLAGSGGLPVPHQVACSVTLRTPLRRHWGRFYLPYLKGNDGPGGQLLPATVDSIANAARTALTGPQTSQGIVPVVWDRNRKIVYSITDLEVDSVTDIIRRRRPRASQYKKILSA